MSEAFPRSEANIRDLEHIIISRQKSGLLLSEIAERLRVPKTLVHRIILGWLRKGEIDAPPISTQSGSA